MRDRFIDILAEDCDMRDARCAVCDKECREWRFGKRADRLLAAGVIVPPVALGSRHKIYYPIKGTNAVCETKVYGIGVDEDGDMTINPTEYPEEVIGFRGVTLGKDVFLTREEAEQALKERREG